MHRHFSPPPLTRRRQRADAPENFLAIFNSFQASHGFLNRFGCVDDA
jgi:hypothetical protein